MPAMRQRADVESLINIPNVQVRFGWFLTREAVAETEPHYFGYQTPQFPHHLKSNKFAFSPTPPSDFDQQLCKTADRKFWKQSRFSEKMVKKQEGFGPTLFSTRGLVLPGWHRVAPIRLVTPIFE